MRSPGSILPTLALALFAVFLAVSVSRAARVAGGAVLVGWEARGETPLQERIRAYGPGYTRAIEEIRRTIPPDGAYILVSDAPEEDGAPVWVKFDLAPRRVIYLGPLRSLEPADQLRKRMHGAARWVVIARGSYRPPELIERFRFIQERKRREGA